MDTLLTAEADDKDNQWAGKSLVGILSAWSSLLLPSPVWNLRPLQLSWKLGMENVLVTRLTPDVPMYNLLIRLSLDHTCISQKTIFYSKGSLWFSMVRFPDIPCNMSTWLTLPGAPILVDFWITGTAKNWLGSWSRNITNLMRVDFCPINSWYAWIWSIRNRGPWVEEITYICPLRD